MTFKGIKRLSVLIVEKHEGCFFIIATLTRDILSILAFSASVERLLSTTRNIYYYRRRRIKSKIIKELIKFLYTLRVNLKSGRQRRIKVVKEEKDKRSNKVNIDGTSDTKELVDKSNNLIEINNNSDNSDNSDNSNNYTRPLLLESSI
ncbi:uncharacterized protein N7446_011663 [Penicillium canescens]|uniref:uncharacterized protein n=1 Tax=Penicillium canescens TaxID=5083 RepID=UPI0026E0FFD3|nr:uncharacterized protein N7446_011663 [Penicillium canescens]KAJ6048980.1 hypothetical protein N7446_011663 [Penicillium canescens]